MDFSFWTILRELLPSGHQSPKLKLCFITFTGIYLVQPSAHSSCTSLFILLVIKSTVYCFAHLILLHILRFMFLFIFLPVFIYILLCCILHCPLGGPDLIYISLRIIFCIIEYVMNKRTIVPWTLNMLTGRHACVGLLFEIHVMHV